MICFIFDCSYGQRKEPDEPEDWIDATNVRFDKCKICSVFCLYYQVWYIIQKVLSQNVYELKRTFRCYVLV